MGNDPQAVQAHEAERASRVSNGVVGDGAMITVLKIRVAFNGTRVVIDEQHELSDEVQLEVLRNAMRAKYKGSDHIDFYFRDETPGRDNKPFAV